MTAGRLRAPSSSLCANWRRSLWDRAAVFAQHTRIPHVSKRQKRLISLCGIIASRPHRGSCPAVCGARGGRRDGCVPTRGPWGLGAKPANPAADAARPTTRVRSISDATVNVFYDAAELGASPFILAIAPANRELSSAEISLSLGRSATKNRSRRSKNRKPWTRGYCIIRSVRFALALARVR